MILMYPLYKTTCLQRPPCFRDHQVVFIDRFAVVLCISNGILLPRDFSPLTAMLCVDQTGSVAAGVSTSGPAFKIPGRVGDSPLPGCGFYANNRGGAAAGEYSNNFHCHNCNTWFGAHKAGHTTLPHS